MSGKRRLPVPPSIGLKKAVINMHIERYEVFIFSEFYYVQCLFSKIEAACYNADEAHQGSIILIRKIF